MSPSDQERGRRYYLSLSLSVLNGQFHSHLQIYLVSACLRNVIINCFWSKTKDPSWGRPSLGLTYHQPPHMKTSSRVWEAWRKYLVTLDDQKLYLRFFQVRSRKINSYVSGLTILMVAAHFIKKGISLRMYLYGLKTLRQQALTAFLTLLSKVLGLHESAAYP